MIKAGYVSCTKHGMAGRVLLEKSEEFGDVMLKLNIDNIGEVAIVECEGRIVQSDAAFKLLEVVTLQSDARTVVLDLSQVDAIEGGGLGMLVFLQRWAQDHDIRFKLFNPCRSVRERLKKVRATSEFDIPTLDELMAVLAQADRRHAVAA
jgi:anti-anti-sigma regulatory factor